MDKVKWYEKLLIVLVVIIFLPLIFAAIIIAGVSALFRIPKNKKEYKKSRYYLDFKQKFMTSLLYSPEYRFYNSAIHRNLPIQYVKQESNGFEYFIFDGTLYLFPDFDQIDYDEEKSEWQADYDGDWVSFEEAVAKLFDKLEIGFPNIPVKILIERNCVVPADTEAENIPDCVFVTWSYENAFENEESPFKTRCPKSSKELYDMMLQTPFLCGKFYLSDDGKSVVWDLYENIKLEISLEESECCFSVSKTIFGKVESGITHWHPTAFDVYEEICKIGKEGNVLVIRTRLGASSVLYMGDKRCCPYTGKEKCLFGKLYYLEAKAL